MIIYVMVKRGLDTGIFRDRISNASSRVWDQPLKSSLTVDAVVPKAAPPQILRLPGELRRRRAACPRSGDPQGDLHL